DSIRQSFLEPVKVFDFKKEAQTLQHVKLSGNIILHSDTTITIDSTAVLSNVLVYAPVILIKDGFHGQCQLFAADSISAGKNCRFDYPSCLGIVRIVSPPVPRQAKITLNANTTFSGIIFTYEKKPSDIKPLITISKGDTVKGQLYSQEILELKDHAVIYGSAVTESLLYKTAFTIYVNYLINVTVDSRSLSPYYLSSSVLPGTSKKKKVLQWLEGN